ncbi:MAG: GtrA family protein [Acidimicrobiales bacterium]
MPTRWRYPSERAARATSPSVPSGPGDRVGRPSRATEQADQKEHMSTLGTADARRNTEPATDPQRWSRLAAVRARPGLVRQLARYTLASVVSTVVSEVTLIGLYGGGLLGAAWAAVAANLAGAVPSYLLSRYWIWSAADRARPGRQVALYLTTSIISLVASTAATSAAASWAPGPHDLRLAIVSFAYIATYGLLWVVKFGFYRRYLFRHGARAG